MYKIYSNLFKGGTRGAVTMSFDDACREDERLIEIFDHYGIKATFNLNAGREHPTAISPARFSEVYRDHEIASHGYNHLDVTTATDSQVSADVLLDRQGLERLTSRVIDGYAYPFGTYDDRGEEILSCLGIKYARTVENTGKFSLPKDFLRWHPTCHQSTAQDCVDSFISRLDATPYLYREPTLFYIWGHGFEFRNADGTSREDEWQRFSQVCERISKRQDVWYATNSEIYEYVTAMRGIKFSVDNTLAYNPTRHDVWVTVVDPLLDLDWTHPVVVRLPSGETTDLVRAYDEANK